MTEIDQLLKLLTNDLSAVESTVGFGHSDQHAAVNAKHDFAPIDSESVLNAVRSLPITTWTYRGDTARHIGPTAQDFHARFAVGSDERSIRTLDAQGVALAAIPALARRQEAQAVSSVDSLATHTFTAALGGAIALGVSRAWRRR